MRSLFFSISLLTSQQPENNLVRVAIQAMAAVLGGCQSLHTNAYDEALGLPGELSARLALNTQQVLAYETGAALTADPMGGSFAVEAMTDELEARTASIMAEIEKRGGAVAAVDAGYYQQCIAEAAFRYQREVERGERKVVGVNVNVSGVEDEDGPSFQKIDASLEKDSIARAQALRKSRNAAKAKAALASVQDAARKNEDHMGAILSAARARCTVGEICGALREVYGEYRGRK